VLEASSPPTGDPLTPLARVLADTVAREAAFEVLRASGAHQALLLRLTALVSGRAEPLPVAAAAVRELCGVGVVDSAAVVRAGAEGALRVSSWHCRDPRRVGAGGPTDAQLGLVSKAVARRSLSCGAAGVAAPVFMDGAVWGAVVACPREGLVRPALDVLPPLVAGVAGIVGMAASNETVRAELLAEADAQAVVARMSRPLLGGGPPGEALDRALDELTELTGVGHALVLHVRVREASSAVDPRVAVCEVVAGRIDPLPRGSVHALGRDAPVVRALAAGVPLALATGGGPFTRLLRDAGVEHLVPAPLVVGGASWGSLALTSSSAPSAAVRRAAVEAAALVGVYLERVLTVAGW